MNALVSARAFPAFTTGHEYVVHHVNGNVGTVYRPGWVKCTLQAKAIFRKRHDIKAIEISEVRSDGTRVYLETINGRNTKRAKPTKAPSSSFFNASMRKVGGLTFVRLGRLSLSFCLTSKAA